MRPDPPHRLRLYPIMSFAEGRLQVSHKFERTFLDVNVKAAMAAGADAARAVEGATECAPRPAHACVCARHRCLQNAMAAAEVFAQDAERV